MKFDDHSSRKIQDKPPVCYQCGSHFNQIKIGRKKYQCGSCGKNYKYFELDNEETKKRKRVVIRNILVVVSVISCIVKLIHMKNIINPGEHRLSSDAMGKEKVAHNLGISVEQLEYILDDTNKQKSENTLNHKEK